jgi:hypothetical protein
MLLNILSQGADPSDLEDDPEYNSRLTKLLLGITDAQVLRTKINSISRLFRMYKNLVENQDALLQIKMANDGMIPRGLLLAGRSAIRDALRDFELAKSLDQENEKRPAPKKL